MRLATVLCRSWTLRPVSETGAPRRFYSKKHWDKTSKLDKTTSSQNRHEIENSFEARSSDDDYDRVLHPDFPAVYTWLAMTRKLLVYMVLKLTKHHNEVTTGAWLSELRHKGGVLLNFFFTCITDVE